jgi:pimeloyl-ACP methyl ester carboxylesterase
MKRIDVNEVELNVDEAGSGEPLVLVHGSWSDHRTWDPVKEMLARSFRVISFDRRGHGKSARPAGTRRDQEDDLAGLIELVANEPVRLVGTSFGGSIAIGLASRRPDLVQALVVHEPPLISLAAGDPAATEDLLKVADSIAALTARVERGDLAGAAEQFVEEVALGPGGWQILPQQNKETMVDTAESFVFEQRDPEAASVDRAALTTIEPPTLLMRGKHSPRWFSGIVDQLAAAISGARIHTFDDAGHAPHLTHPDEFVTVVAGFLSRSLAPTFGG